MLFGLGCLIKLITKIFDLTSICLYIPFPEFFLNIFYALVNKIIKFILTLNKSEYNLRLDKINGFILRVILIFYLRVIQDVIFKITNKVFITNLIKIEKEIFLTQNFVTNYVFDKNIFKSL